MYIAIGKLAQTYGVHGHIKAIPYSGIPERFLDLSVVYLDTGRGMNGFIIEEADVYRDGGLLKLKGVNTPEEARRLLQKELWVPQDQQVDLPDGSFFVHQLIGMTVQDSEGRSIGILQDVLLSSGNDIYVVRDGEKEILIPAVSEFVKSINLDNQTITVELIDGMAD